MISPFLEKQQAWLDALIFSGQDPTDQDAFKIESFSRSQLVQVFAYVLAKAHQLVSEREEMIGRVPQWRPN